MEKDYNSDIAKRPHVDKSPPFIHIPSNGSHKGYVDDGLEVVPQTESTPIVIPDSCPTYAYHGKWAEGMELRPDEEGMCPTDSRDSGTCEVGGSEHTETEPSEPEAPEPKPKRILGLKRIVLVAIIVIGIILIGGAIGGAIGGTRASRKKKVESNPEYMSFRMQIWENPGYEGRSQFFYTPGGYRTAFLARSYRWSPGELGNGKLRCSMGFCLGDYPIGWWGLSERSQPGKPDNLTWGATVINIKCAKDFADPGCPDPIAISTFTTVPFSDATKAVNLSQTIPAPTASSYEDLGFPSSTAIS